jgi:hypothetical protein
MSSPLISDNNDVPEWHIAIVKERTKNYVENPEQASDFDWAMNEIEADLDRLSGN